MHKRKYIELSENPGSFVSYASSLKQDAILGVPCPFSSSLTVASNVDHFEPHTGLTPPEVAFQKINGGPELSDLEEELFPELSSSSKITSNYEEQLDSIFGIGFCGGVTNSNKNSQSSYPNIGTSDVAEALLQLLQL